MGSFAVSGSQVVRESRGKVFVFWFPVSTWALAKIEVVRFWIGLIRLFIDWPQHGEEPYYWHRTPKWAKNDH